MLRLKGVLVTANLFVAGMVSTSEYHEPILLASIRRDERISLLVGVEKLTSQKGKEALLIGATSTPFEEKYPCLNDPTSQTRCRSPIASQHVKACLDLRLIFSYEPS